MSLVVFIECSLIVQLVSLAFRTPLSLFHYFGCPSSDARLMLAELKISSSLQTWNPLEQSQTINLNDLTFFSNRVVIRFFSVFLTFWPKLVSPCSNYASVTLNFNQPDLCVFFLLSYLELGEIKQENFRWLFFKIYSISFLYVCMS